MVLVYSLLPHTHPAAIPCERFLSAHSGWFTSPLVLFEARNLLIKVYGVDPGAATHKLMQVSTGPIVLLDFAAGATASVLQLVDVHALDLTDATLLHLAGQHGASHPGHRGSAPGHGV